MKALKTVQNTESKNFGKEFIGGTLDIQTDDEGCNIVTVNFTYVTEMTAKGTKNATFAVLKNIIDGNMKPSNILLDKEIVSLFITKYSMFCLRT